MPVLDTGRWSCVPKEAIKGRPVYIKIPVGSYRVDEPVVWRETYETASWYMDVEVPPGEYPVVAYCDYRFGMPHIGHSLYARGHGKIVDGLHGRKNPEPCLVRNTMADRIGKMSDVSRRFVTSFPTGHYSGWALFSCKRLEGREGDHLLGDGFLSRHSVFLRVLLWIQTSCLFRSFIQARAKQEGN